MTFLSDRNITEVRNVSIFHRTTTASILLAATLATACGSGNDGQIIGRKQTLELNNNGADPTGEDANREAARPLTSDTPINEGIANYRGYLAINALVMDRMIVEQPWFNIGYYLNGFSFSSGDDTVEGLPALLGHYEGNGLDSGFRNGKPNAINVVLYHLLMSSLAVDLASRCATGSPTPPPAPDRPGPMITLRPEFRAAIAPVCAWPETTAMSDEALLGLWLAVMKFDAPSTEFAAWKEFVRSEYSSRTAAESLPDMLLAILMNPHFLIQK